MNRRLMLLTVFGLGHMRPASGTWGSTPPVVVALVLVWLLGSQTLGVFEHITINVALVLIGLIFTIACIKFGAEAEAKFGKKDPGQVVADEVAGQCVALLALPWRAMTDTDALLWNGAMAAIAFFSFRVLDILKPPPAHQSQQLGGGLGIVVDDLIAGFYALIVTQLAARFLLPM